MKSLAMLWAVITVAASDPVTSDCVGCLRGKCLVPAVFFDNRKVLRNSKATVYLNDNIMYYRDTDDLFKIKAINLDTNTAEAIPMLTQLTANMGIDVVNGDLYYYKLFEHKIYKYQPQTNESSVVEVSEMDTDKLPPARAWAFDGTLYFNRRINLETVKGLYFLNGTMVQRIAELEDIVVHDVVFDANGDMYIRSSRKLYKYTTNADGSKQLKLIDIPNVVRLVNDKEGVLYVFDTIRNLIYELDPDNEKLNEIGAYRMPRLANFVLFDKTGNIIFRASDKMCYYKVSTDECVFNVLDDGRSRFLNITKISK